MPRISNQTIFRAICASIFLLLLSIICFNISGCSANQTNQSADQRFRAFTRQLFCEEVNSSTISLHYTLQNPEEYGITRPEVSFGNISTDLESAGAALENVRAQITSLDSSNLSDENKLTMEVLSSYIDTSMEGIPYTLYQEPLSLVNGVQGQIPVLLSEFRLDDTDDVEVYLRLIDTLPVYFESIVTFEKEKAKQGLFMSDMVADEVIAQCQAFIEMGNHNYLLSTFVDKIKQIDDMDGDLLEAYVQQNAKAVTETMTRAYTYLQSEVEKLKGSGKNNGGVCNYPKGKEFYSYAVKRQTGSSKSIPEIKEMTKKQMIEDLEAMEEALGIVWSEKSSEEARGEATEEVMGEVAQEVAAVSVAKSNAVTMLQDLQGQIANAFPQPPDVTARIKYVPNSMEEVLSPAFYMIPPIDHISENVIYVNEAQVTNELALYTTLAHEGYPGHLYQTVYFSNQNPDEIRQLLDYGGYVEGWATYAEMMSYYFAPLSKEQAVLCQKNASIMLGLYTLADIGIHYEGWTQAETAQFFSKYGITDGAAVANIYQLILGAPGNYLKYYIGYLEFLEIKREMMSELGNAFSQKAFHEAILNCGPAPFDILENQVRMTLMGGR